MCLSSVTMMWASYSLYAAHVTVVGQHFLILGCCICIRKENHGNVTVVSPYNHIGASACACSVLLCRLSSDKLFAADT